MDAAEEEIDRGAVICSTLKQAYYSDKHWSECHDDVVRKFNELKKQLRVFFSLTKNDNVELFKKIQHYKPIDLKDILDN